MNTRPSRHFLERGEEVPKDLPTQLTQKIEQLRAELQLLGLHNPEKASKIRRLLVEMDEAKINLYHQFTEMRTSPDVIRRLLIHAQNIINDN